MTQNATTRETTAGIPAKTPLLDRLLAVEVAATVGHSMGDVTEGMHWKEIEEKFGLVDRMLPQPQKWATKAHNMPVVRGYPNVFTVHDRPAGMSEDGHERHRLSATAVIEKGGRVGVEDVAAVWLRDIDPAKFGILLGPQDQVIYYAAKAGVPPWEVGRYAYFPGAWGVTAMMVPVGAVNAGDPRAAAADARDVGRLKDQEGIPGNFAIDVAAAVAAAVAESLSNDTSTRRVIEAALAQLSPVPRAEVERALEWCPAGSDWRGLRGLLDTHYVGKALYWPVESLGTALALLELCDADPFTAIVAATNLGRDTDGRACVVGALAAGLRGNDALPPEWEETIAAQVVTDPYTVSTRTPRETAAGLLAAVEGNLAQIRHQLGRVTV